MKTAYLSKLPMCDICKKNLAAYDAPWRTGSWAYQCEYCHMPGTIGLKLEKKVVAKAAPVVEAFCDDWEAACMYGVMTLTCGDCGNEMTVEPDFEGKITCGACGRANTFVNELF